MDKDVHGLNTLFNYFLETTEIPVFLVLYSVSNVHAVHPFLLAPDLNVHNNSLEEVPSDGEIVGPLRARPDNKVTNWRVFHHVYGWDCTNVLEFGV